MWEKTQTSKKRTVLRRIAHAIGFQIVLVMILIPLIAWWMQISLVKAFLLDFSLMVLIPCYTFVYNYFFDHIFGLPSHLLESTELNANASQWLLWSRIEKADPEGSAFWLKLNFYSMRYRRSFGKIAVKVEPSFSFEVISRCAPCCMRTCLTMASPKPVPPVWRLRALSTR